MKVSRHEKYLERLRIPVFRHRENSGLEGEPPREGGRYTLKEIRPIMNVRPLTERTRLSSSCYEPSTIKRFSTASINLIDKYHSSLSWPNYYEYLLGRGLFSYGNSRDNISAVNSLVVTSETAVGNRPVLSSVWPRPWLVRQCYEMDQRIIRKIAVSHSTALNTVCRL